MRLHLLALGSALCIAASASAVPNHLADRERGANGNGNGLGYAYGHFKSKSDLAESARSACWKLPVAGDFPTGPVSSNGGTPHGFGDLGSGGSGAGGPQPTGSVPAVPEPTGALLFGAGVALVTLRLRRR